MNQYRDFIREKKNPSGKKKKQELPYTDKELDNGPKMAPIALEPMPEDQRDREKERIFRDKMYMDAEDLRKIRDNAVKMGFLSKSIADDMIRAADSLHKWMLPLTDDTWTQGKWINAYPQYAATLKDDYDLSEDSMMIRYRYKILKDGTVKNEHPYTKEHMVGTSLEKKFNIVAQIADNQPFDFFKLIWENDERTRHQQILKREEKKSENRTGKKKKKKVHKISDYTTDPDDYDNPNSEIHGNIMKYPPTPKYFENKEEYDRILEAEALGLVKKDRPDDYTEFNKFIEEYQKTPKYKRQKAAYEHYKERLKVCKTREDFLKALMDYKKEKNSNI